MSGVRKDRQLREFTSGAILTSNAAPANVAQLTPEDDQAFTLWGMLTAHDTGLSVSAHWLFMLSGRRVTGTVTVERFKILEEAKNIGLVAADFNVDLATPVLSFQVTGVVATTIRWRIQVFGSDAGAAV